MVVGVCPHRLVVVLALALGRAEISRRCAGGPQIPDLQAAVLRARVEPLPVLALNMVCQCIHLWMYVIPAADLHRWRHLLEPDRRHVVRVALECPDRPLLVRPVHVVQPHVRVAGSSDPLLVGRDLELVDLRALELQCVVARPIRRFPQPDHVVVASRCEQD